MKYAIGILLLILTATNLQASESIQSYMKDISEASVKLDEHRKVLENYENHSYTYGRQGLDIQSHTQANIRYYEELIKEKVAKLQELESIAKTTQHNTNLH